MAHLENHNYPERFYSGFVFLTLPYTTEILLSVFVLNFKSFKIKIIHEFYSVLQPQGLLYLILWKTVITILYSIF